MVARLITPPSVSAVSLDAARRALRIDGNDQDADIAGWVEGIVEDAEHLLGRAFVEQGWRVTLPAFQPIITLRMAPLIEVVSLKYIDPDGQVQLLDAAEYLVDTAAEPGNALPAPGKIWPDTAVRPDAVVVDYTCGYGADDTTVPKAIQLYVLAKLVEQYDPAARLERDTVQSNFIGRVKDRYKVFG